jgi:hypothetical protein
VEVWIMKRILVHQVLVITRREFEFSVVRHIKISLRPSPIPDLTGTRFSSAAPNRQRRDAAPRTPIPLCPRWRETPETAIRIPSLTPIIGSGLQARICPPVNLPHHKG